MTSATTHGYTRRLAALLSLTFLSMALWLTAAGPAFACSCVGPQPMAAYATADNAVFSGTAGPRDNRGVPVRVSAWFSGRGAAPIIYLAAQSFGDSAACGTNVPNAGTDWIWVTYLPEGGGDPIAGLCSPHAQLGTPEGDAMLKDATATFGGVVPLGGSPSDPPGVAATDPPASSPESPTAPLDSGALIALITLGLGLAVLAGVVLLARRRTAA
jgi:hypothetical protein